MICFNFLRPAVTRLNYSVSKQDSKPTNAGRSCAISPLNKFFMMLCRLRQAFKEKVLAYHFQLSQPSVCLICNTCISFLFYKFKEVPLWPSWDVIDFYMPTCFRSMYPTTRCIIDATEIFIECQEIQQHNNWHFLIIKTTIFLKRY